ncbi:MAG: hypothetical protein GF329_08340 [Candidatus Lokiarchaeota archaeon]|nr:hypothetical protein [Candidatus Lokiarchaeota archaeon]
MSIAEKIMLEFANETGLSSDKPPRRYLWTDAFAVFNFIQLYKQTEDHSYKQLAIDLVDQVHNILGKHRTDDDHEGWLANKDHPTKKGLRIGKKLPERKPNEEFNQRLEWERNGQYFHYLTKWMLALIKMGQICKNKKYYKWAVDLLKASLAFIHDGKMYWKMSIDLSRPLIPSMGQHDPLNGYVTFKVVDIYTKQNLRNEIRKIQRIMKSIQLSTIDPLGIGELLVDAYKLYLMNDDPRLISDILEGAELGLKSFNVRTHSLAFRELGLAIGLEAAEKMNKLKSYWNIKPQIVDYWMNHQNWVEHKDINQVMLATSWKPDEFLRV